MAHRITRPEMESLVAEITAHAVTLDLLPPGSKIWWVPGKAALAPSVPATAPHHSGVGLTPVHVSFLPEFKYRDTTADAHRALAATCTALAVLAGRL